jgi:hypothetical protein
LTAQRLFGLSAGNLVGGEGFAVDVSLIAADANNQPAERANRG